MELLNGIVKHLEYVKIINKFINNLLIRYIYIYFLLQYNNVKFKIINFT